MAQAYLGEPNSLSAAIDYNYAPSGKIIATTGSDDDAFDDEVPGIPMHIHTVTLSTQYMTPVPGLAVEAALPLVGAKLGDTHFVHYPMPGPYDDGDMHWTFTDVKGGFRYQFKQIEEYIGLSLNLQASVPTHDYPTNGFMFPDHHLKALYMGGAIARTLDPVLSNAYFQVEYTYVKRERVDVNEETERYSRDFSDSSALLGYFLPANFNIAAGANWRNSHGGIGFGDLIFQNETVQFHHDRLLAEDFVLVGGNLGYSLSDSVDLGAAVRFFVWGENTRNQNIFALTADYKFF